MGVGKHSRGASPDVDVVTPPSNAKPAKPIVCYDCGQEEHKRPNCPKLSNGKKNGIYMRPITVNIPKKQKNNVVKGRLGDKVVAILADTGADYGLVPKSLVPKSALLGFKCMVTGIHGKPMPYEVAECTFVLQGKELTKWVVAATLPLHGAYSP